MEMKILIPIDGSNTARRTLEKIISLKEHFPKQLTLLHVVDVDKLAYRMIPDFQIDMVRENAGKAGQHGARQRAKASSSKRPALPWRPASNLASPDSLSAKSPTVSPFSS